MLICKFCSKECKNENSHRNHERLCPKNFSRVYTSGMLDKTSHKKGLTKETSEEIARQSKTIKDNYVSGKTKKPTGGMWTEEMRKRQSDWKIQLHIDHPELHPNRLLAGNRTKMSYPERVAYDFLESANIKFSHNLGIDKFFPDFVIGKIIIEIDGANWHNKEKDRIRDNKLRELGFTVFRIDSKDNIHNRITEILKLPSVG